MKSYRPPVLAPHGTSSERPGGDLESGLIGRIWAGSVNSRILKLKESEKKYKLILWISSFIVFSIIISIDNKKLLEYEFDGRVESVNYNIQRTPTITINGIEYKLSYDEWYFNIEQIEIGDKMVKKKGKMSLILVKRNSADTINLLFKSKN